MAKKESSQQASEQQEGKVDRIDNALQKFSDMLIARMEQMKESKWKKGWTDGRTAQFGLPQNLVGRPYTGSNAFLCQIHTTMEHYRMPVYLTIKQIRDAGGMIKKGEHSIPIFKWDLRIKDKDGKKLSESDYRNMTKEEQAECTVRPYLKVYNEWNIDQTNLEEVNKEKYDAILNRFKSEPIKDEVGMYKNEAFDNLLKEQSWVCPIEYEKFNESAFYSPKRDQIVVPSKKQFNISNTPEDVFKDGMEFYGTTIHEMAHSTGHESRLGRDGIVKIDQFGSDQYAKEELVAELTSALIGNAMGFDSRIRENNIAYLQNWIGSLKKDPKFLKSVMSDVNKSSKMVLEHIDEQRRKLGEKALLDGSLDGEEEKNKNEQQLQDLKEEDAKKEVVAKVWPSVNNKITMPSGDILTVDYNKEKDTLEVAYKTSEGEEKVHCTNYDHSQGINQNLGYVWEELSNMKQFQEKETKTEILSQGKDYFTSLMETITSTPNSEHTVLSVKTLPELRDYYKGNPNVGAWINQASNKEIIEAGADFLPNLRYSHKEGRSLYNIEAAYSNINALYPDVVDNDAKRQIVHRIKQAEEVVTSYHNNIEEKFGKEFLMEKENMNKVLSRNDYQEQGKAKQIASTGVPMEEAEKKASSIVKEEVHKEHHKQEAEKDKQEKDKANQAAAEEKKEQQEKKEESKEVSEATAKALTHAALLVGALSAAKQNEGIWMNKSQKGNAEFINTHTPITAYNNIMMNLNSDANKYKTNVYTYYNPAKENHMPVKQNEKGMEFHWTSWEYQNAMDKDEVITSKQFDKLPDDEKSFYTKHATRVMQNIYNVEQTTMNANNHDAYVEILKNKGAQLSQNEKEQKGKYSSIMKQWKELKGKHPDALLLFRIGDFYEMYKQDAKRGSEVLGITLTKMNESKDFHLAGFPHQALDTYLPKLIRAGERVAICDQLESKKTVSQSFDAKAILNKAYATAKEVAKQSGMQYERVMVLQDAKYDSKEDKIVVSGMKGEVGNEKMAALYKANDIYRAVVAATGTENRLDRSGRNNLLPEDDAKHEQLVRELAAGVMMARQGLPAILSKENEKLIPYWEREIKENPKLLGIVERDVNNAVETIDNLVAKRKVDYESIRGQLPGKTMEKPSKYSISQDLAKLPNIETKEIVVVKDILRKEADVILPAGASLEVNNEVPGMRKDRITIALKKEGIDDVRFYNAGGSLGLNKPNSYFQGKEVTLNNLKQYELVPHHTLDVEKQAAPKKEVIIKNFQAIKDDNGRYAFFIKPENEPSFSVYPAKEHLNTFYNVIKTDKQAIVHNALAQRYYEMATKHPDTKLDLITPKKVDVDMKLIERPSITSSAQDAKQKLIFATINGQRVQAPINKQQWQKMWLAEDMGAYKRALAAVIFEPMLKRGMEEEQSQQAVSESEKVEIKEKPAPENKVQETVTETHRTGLHM